MRRIVVIGATGAGKTTLAQMLARRLDLAFIDLDDLYWLPGWTPRPEDAFHAAIVAACAADGWLLAGNYARTRAFIWPRADTVIWLDYGFPTVFARLIRRSLIRLVQRTAICNGNRESWRKLLSRDSIMLWLLQTFAKKRRDYGAIFAQPQDWPAIRFIHLHNQGETDRLIASVSPQ